MSCVGLKLILTTDGYCDRVGGVIERCSRVGGVSERCDGVGGVCERCDGVGWSMCGV